MSSIDFSQMSPAQKQKLLKHIEDFKNNPQLMDGENEYRLESISSQIGTGGSIDDEIDIHMLAVYIANTYEGENGDPWFHYIRALGLPQDLI